MLDLAHGRIDDAERAGPWAVYHTLPNVCATTE
jgi:hypothetical protein